jgi:2-keto-4-pentenoate hydratase/2-oxohepta-3-ene-1,7-dioic acid hydratase in catechol pathway
MIVLQQFARKLRARAAAKSTPTWTGKGPMPDDVQGWPDRSASTDEADADKPLGFRTNDVPNPYAEGPYTAPPPKPKPVYCLGWNTINYVREHGTLETENIAFIAASDLLHDPRPDASAGLIEAANALSFAATCLEDAQQPNAAEYCRRAEARARAADRSGK